MEIALLIEIIPLFFTTGDVEAHRGECLARGHCELISLLRPADWGHLERGHSRASVSSQELLCDRPEQERRGFELAGIIRKELEGINGGSRAVLMATRKFCPNESRQ